MVTEPLLLPTARVTLPAGSNTADTARADVSAESKWNLFGESILRRKSVPRSGRNLKTIPTIPRIYRHPGDQKRHAYNARILAVESGLFTGVLNIWGMGRLVPYSRGLQQR